ncbi:MAG: hypothetical protein V5A55_05615 [Halovenus sp.]
MTETQIDTRYKVGRVLRKYDLDDFHDDLEARWSGQGYREERSLRELADELNTAILRSAMAEAGTDPLEGEVENAYRLLTDDDVTAGVRTQQRNRLEQQGLDVAAVESDFVTHQAVYNYLRKALGASKKENEEVDPVEKQRERVNRLRSRTAAVMESSLSELESTGEFSLGTADSIVSLQVYCQDCGNQYEFEELLQRGGCDCD